MGKLPVRMRGKVSNQSFLASLLLGINNASRADGFLLSEELSKKNLGHNRPLHVPFLSDCLNSTYRYAPLSGELHP